MMVRGDFEGEGAEKKNVLFNFKINSE